MTKNRLGYLFLMVIVTAAFSSCLSNEIYFDADKQLICSSNSKALRRISIEANRGNEYYTVEWTDPIQKAPTQLSLNPLTKGYVIKAGFGDSIVDLKNFALNPNVIYEISRSGGDAGSCAIKVSTDEHGHFQKTEGFGK